MITVGDYEKILNQLYRKTFVSPTLQDMMEADHTPKNEVTIVYSPFIAAGQTCHYGHGNWVLK